MRPSLLLAAAVLAASASAASAQGGCHRAHRGLASDRVSRGANAAEPSRAIDNPCSSMYGFGKNVRAMEKRKYPNAVVRH